MKLSKSFLFYLAKKEEEEKKERTYKLDPEHPLKYFYEMYTNHVYDSTMTWGDVFRLYKYFMKF